MQVNDTIQLQAISKHGKQRLHQFGNTWLVKKITDKVFFSDKKGTWLGLTDAGGKNDFRWIHSTNDKNFKIC